MNLIKGLEKEIARLTLSRPFYFCLLGLGGGGGGGAIVPPSITSQVKRNTTMS